MIVIDTNVVSEFIGSPPAEQVLAWLNGQNAAELYITSITIAEIHYGLECLPQGRRRVGLEDGFETFLSVAFFGRVLDFDANAAAEYGQIRARRRSLGRPITAFDAQIAAIARVNKCSVATRNIKDFELCGVELLNPFLD